MSKLYQYLRYLAINYSLLRKPITWLYMLKSKCSNKNEYKKILKLMDIFCDADDLKSPRYIRKIIKDVYLSKLIYGVYVEEYFKYNFEKLSDVGRKEFIGNIERNQFLDEMGDEYSKNILNDKYESYCKFKKYYKRDIVKIQGEDDKLIFDKFCQEHSNFLVKPIDAEQGNGIYKVDLQKDSREKIWKKIIQSGVSLLEELIVQTNDLGRFHPESVNTVRFATYMKDNKVASLFACLRMGVGDSVVDNIGAGGICALIDIETGIIYTPGKKYNGDMFIKHPDTDVCIIGYQIPKWNELCKIVEEAAKVLPEYNYISWDFSLTDKGWIIVEANDRGGFSHIQMFSGHGLRKLYEKLSK